MGVVRKKVVVEICKVLSVFDIEMFLVWVVMGGGVDIVYIGFYIVLRLMYEFFVLFL